MNKFTWLAASSLVPLLLVSPAHADLALATSKGCTVCHQIDKKVLGPAYGQVAACYANKDAKKLADSRALLVKHVKEGGLGTWGPIPMPAHPAVSNEDISKIIEWVMTQKPMECPKEFKPKS